MPALVFSAGPTSLFSPNVANSGVHEVHRRPPIRDEYVMGDPHMAVYRGTDGGNAYYRHCLTLLFGRICVILDSREN